MSLEPGIVQAQIRIDLRSLAYQAKRCPYVSRKFLLADPPEPLTEWDRRHPDIDALLDALIGC